MLILLFTNCRKEDVSETVRFNKTETVERFFKLPATVDCEIKALANNQKNKILYLIFYQNSLPKMVIQFGIKLSMMYKVVIVILYTTL